MLEEFKNFAFKGNAFDLAVGVIIGAAFGKIVGSIVDDLIMPILGGLTGGLDFNNYFVGLNSGVTATTLDCRQGTGCSSRLWQFYYIYDQLPDHCFHPISIGEDFKPLETGRTTSTTASSLDHGGSPQGNPRRAGYCQKEVSVSGMTVMGPGCWTSGPLFCSKVAHEHCIAPHRHHSSSSSRARQRHCQSRHVWLWQARHHSALGGRGKPSNPARNSASPPRKA